MTLAEQPRIEAWMHEEQVSFRQEADDNLRKAAELGILPEIRDRKYFQRGESSVVAKVDLHDGSVVVKLSKYASVAAEGYFLTRWSEVGVKTPQVINFHIANQQLPISLLVMEYVDKPSLADTHSREELVAKGIWKDLGRTQAIMHQIHGNGYGTPQKGNWETGTYATFTEAVSMHLFQDRIPYLLKHSIIDDKTVDLVHRAVSILEQDSQGGRRPVLIHDDFMPYNMFDTDPPTIFDPLPSISHPYVCLAYPIFKLMTLDPRIDTEKNQFLAGYEEVTPVDRKVLSAAIILRGIGKLRTWNEKGKFKAVERVKEVIKEQAQEIV